MGRLLMKIRTNHHWRNFTYRCDVPAAVLADQFDYHNDDTTDGYFKYRGYWYHLDQFMRIGYPGPFGQIDENGYHGYHSDSYFSGFQVATYIS